MKPETPTLETLPRAECLRLLDENLPRVGRVGFVQGGTPVILPVNYRVFRGQVVFRTEWGTALAEATGQGRTKVAFEVDALDPGWREGWSVLVQGEAHRVLDSDHLASLQRLPLHPWAPGDRPLYLQVEPTEITGRRIR